MISTFLKSFKISLKISIILRSFSMAKIFFVFLANSRVKTPIPGPTSKIISFGLRLAVSVIFLSILSATLYGISDEIHQHFVPTRSADIWDAAADMLGSIVGVFIIHHALSRRTHYSGVDKTPNLL